MREQRQQALAQIVEGLRTNYEVAQTNEERLQAEVQHLEEKVQKLNHKEIQAAALEQVVMTNRQSYDAFLRRFMDINTQHEDTVSLVAKIVDAAVAAQTPFKPNKRRIVTVAVILTLMGGVGLAFLLERLDNRLKNREDVEEQLGVPVLGELQELQHKGPENGAVTPELTYLEEPKSTFAEAVRSIRTGIMLSALDKPQQVLVVTSTTLREGKTTVALNLALALGQLRNVLLIDADLRRPALAKLWGLEQAEAGLAELIAGTAKVSECVHRVTGDIHVLPAGKALPQDPLKILSSERFAEVLKKTAQAYDTVVVDSAPVELVSDAKVLAAQASGVLYVIKADDTPYQAVCQGLRNLGQAGAPLLGTVLNRLDPKEATGYARYGRYSRYYAYGRYGYSEAT